MTDEARAASAVRAGKKRNVNVRLTAGQYAAINRRAGEIMLQTGEPANASTVVRMAIDHYLGEVSER